MDLGKPNWGDDSMDDIMGNLVLHPGWLFSCAVLFCCFVVVFSLPLMITQLIPCVFRDKSKKTFSRLGKRFNG